jgi:hypothetical protein
MAQAIAATPSVGGALKDPSPMEWVAAILFFLQEDRKRVLPSDAQTSHLAFEELQCKFHGPLDAFRFVPDPVVPRSEKLESILQLLQLGRIVGKPNSVFAEVKLTAPGTEAIEDWVLDFSAEQKAVARAMASGLADILVDFED